MYSQITVDERYTLGLLRRLGRRPADIARALGRHRSTIGRELARNTRPDGGYRPAFAQARTGARRWCSRCGNRFTPAEFALVTARLALKWSPEQIAAVLRQTGQLAISHETIYRYIWADKRRGGQLHRHLRGAPKLCRKRYGSYERRGRLTGKRPITARPASIETRCAPAPSTPGPASATTIGLPRTAMPRLPERPAHHYRDERCTSHLNSHAPLVVLR